ncbi:nucleotidyltransferase substrate binding protein [bacterium]|nr:nucleotidyltransferase substrate binding protein [bacterium]
MKNKKLEESYSLLKNAQSFWKKDQSEPLAFAAATKAFEVFFEYAWKHFKQEADLAGYETYNPRDAIRAAAQMELIKDPDLWCRFLNARNLSVHDYIGIKDEDFADLMKQLVREGALLLK